MHRPVVLLLLVSLISLSGCSRPEFPTAPVSGRVFLNGQPLIDATVIFQPAASGNSGPASYGETDDEGRFTLWLPNEELGAIIGKHRVMISTRKALPDTTNEDREVEVVPERVPDRYRKAPMTLEVPQDGLKDLEIKL